MSRFVGPVLASWGEAGKRAAFFIALLLGSAAAGFVIAWPLWLFATSARGAYTIFSLAVAAGAIVFLIVRGAARARKASREPASARRRPLAAFLGLLQLLIFLGGLYAAAVLVFHGIWIFAIPVVILWIGVMLLLGMARKAAGVRRNT